MAQSTYEVGTTILLETDITDTNGNLIDPTTISGMVQSPTSTTYYTALTTEVGKYYFRYKVLEEGEHTYAFVSETPSIGLTTHDSGFFIAIRYESGVLDYLIPQLRDHLGDRASGQFTTDFLRQSLLNAFKALIPRWRYKYVIDANDVISRSQEQIEDFVFAEPPIIQKFDERPIILQAAIVIKRGILQFNALSLGSWRDDEISYSNIAGGDALLKSINADEKELEELLPARSRKLAKANKQSLPGFQNIYED